MPRCQECGDYTPYYNGLCSDCYYSQDDDWDDDNDGYYYDDDDDDDYEYGYSFDGNDSQLAGNEFEKYVILKFLDDLLIFKEWRSDKYFDGIYPESSTYPDLEYQIKDGRRFAIECKYRSALKDDCLFLEERQLNNYKNFEKSKNIPVYVAIGLSGEPDSPNEFFFIPLKDIKYGRLSYSFLKKYKRDNSSNFIYDSKTRKFK